MMCRENEVNIPLKLEGTQVQMRSDSFDVLGEVIHEEFLTFLQGLLFVARYGLWRKGRIRLDILAAQSLHQ